MSRPVFCLTTIPQRIAADLWSPTHGSPLVYITRANPSSPPRYDVRVLDPKPLGSAPMDQPQWFPERIVFTGTRVEILAWVRAGHHRTDARAIDRTAAA
jgi:hypothetical protein